MKQQHRNRVSLSALPLLSFNYLTADESFSGLGTNLANLYRTSSAQTRSIRDENLTGESGEGGSAYDGTRKHAARTGPQSATAWQPGVQPLGTERTAAGWAKRKDPIPRSRPLRSKSVRLLRAPNSKLTFLELCQFIIPLKRPAVHT
jgi:hypothetical protein